MKTKNIIYLLMMAAMTVVSLTACNDYLDKMPDNRSEVDSEDKVVSLLTSAYPTHDYIYFNEMMSDNYDRYPRFKNHTVLSDSTWSWAPIMETGTFSPANLWSDCFGGVTAANMALEAIDNLGGPKNAVLKAARAEAIMLRAYCHFLLAVTFCAPFDKAKNAQNLGLPYQYDVERELNPQYERGNLEDYYLQIQADLEEALPDITEDNYTVPKYHFNLNAAYAFATRFYLFTEQWQKAIDCANMVLGTNPKNMLRNWELHSTVARNYDEQAKQWVDAEQPANLMLATTYGSYKTNFGAYSTLNLYSHGAFVAKSETVRVPNFMWSTSYSTSKGAPYLSAPSTYSSNTLDRVLWFKLYYDFQYTNIIKGTGYSRTVWVPFTGDEVLLSRAEAYIMLGEYDKAAADMNTWAKNIYGNPDNITPAGVQTYMSTIDYYTNQHPTFKKHLHPSFDIGAEGDVKESMLQAILFMRRIAGFYEGLRWWDIRRYGIVIYRRDITFDGDNIENVVDELTVDDLRRTLQIPKRSIDAGFQPNPR